MFFPKLRRRAKWVFLLLAIVFAGSFVFFGVGAGGSGIGDYISDFINNSPNTGTPSLDDARSAVDDNPNDAAAQLDLARAAQQAGQVDEAITAYEAYRQMKPKDAAALRSLAALYGQQVAIARREAEVANGRAAEASLQQVLAPSDSPFLQELMSSPATDSLSGEFQARAQTASAEAQRLSRLQLAVYQDLTLIVKDDPLVFLQLAQAAEGAFDYASAIAAYEQFLQLAPNNASAKQVQQRIDQLKTLTGQTGGTGSGDG
ncbi:MAG TPA: tetratricopeptide repeat protein [Gaiellaceae bacterium]|jgi:tetratricopeptide (TPR) repeat protein